jgi:hypothetical protein
MANKENTALAVNNAGFAVLSNADFSAMVNDELDGLDLSFERIKIPSGGATVFEMPGEGDDTETVKEFSGVILYHHPLNAYYKTKYTGGSNPPDCGSFDGVDGAGDPGGKCRQCPFNQYGTGENGAKVCKNRRRVYILREGEIFPLLLSLPTGSLKAFTKYLKYQLAEHHRSNEIVTRFSLKKATNKGGVVYSQAVFSLDRLLTPEEQTAVAKMSADIKAYAKNVGYDEDGGMSDEIICDPETGEVIEPLNGGNAQ